MTIIDEEDRTEYKPRKMSEQGGSIHTTVPKALTRELADELGINLFDLIRDYELEVTVVRKKGSILKGYIDLAIVERGGGLKEKEEE